MLFVNECHHNYRRTWVGKGLSIFGILWQVVSVGPKKKETIMTS